mmetsp:Transcript_8163/g.14539  ORF Transcript_8163/g.14539 Transcript_8163/m.14539 type:complete len:388 (-) Transcript_8163:1097-2260(-)
MVSIDDLLTNIEAGDLEAVKKCVEEDSQLAIKQNTLGRTALHVAAEQGQVFIIHHLAKCKANLNGFDKEEMTPLFLACKAHQPMAVAALLDLKCDANLSGTNGVTALHYATTSVEILGLLKSKVNMPHGDCLAGHPLFWAIKSNEFPSAAFFLDDCKVPLTVTDSVGYTPLHLAASHSSAELTLLLLERGANPNATSSDGSTALHLATNVEVVKHLLTFGADIMIDKAGKSPVQFAEKGALKDILKELQKKEKGGYELTDEKRAQNMEKFKAQGNKVFQAGEYSKSAKFYTLAISFSPQNHVLFSNRSASYYNLRRLAPALADATHCIALNPSWPKGYYRKGATLVLQEKFAEAKAVFEAGLKIDPKNSDLKNGMKDLEKAMAKPKA